MNTTGIISTLEGTPWNSEEEIYEFAVNKKYCLGWDWESVKGALINNGLDENYAESIVASLQEAEKDNDKIKSTAPNKAFCYVLSVAWVIFALCVIRPWAYMWSPEYGRFIFIAIAGFGVTLLRQYRKSL